MKITLIEGWGSYDAGQELEVLEEGQVMDRDGRFYGPGGEPLPKAVYVDPERGEQLLADGLATDGEVEVPKKRKRKAKEV